MSELLAKAQSWLDQDPDPVTRSELQKLIDDENLTELENRFGSRLEFGTAGLRGELGAGPNRMNRVLVAQAAAGIGRYLKPGASVVIGFDGRINSDIFAKDSAEILSGMGLTVYLLDELCPTPLISFATRFLNVSAGIMVTASHNPPRDNGYKVYLGGSFNGSQIITPVDTEIANEIKTVAETETFGSLPKSSNYSIIGPEIREAYKQSVLAAAGPNHGSKLKIVYTAMHGVGWTPVKDIFSSTGIELIPVVEQITPDGSFPTVAFPNPEEPGAMDLAFATAEKNSADLIIANDPDADRVAVALKIAGEYKRLTGDQLGLILADEIAKHHSTGTLACSIVSSSVLAKVAQANGLNFVETLTGFKWISKIEDLVFGFEEALGYCIDPGHVADKDGISAALLIANIATREAESGRTLNDLLDDLGKKYGFYATGQVSIRVTDLSIIGKIVSGLRANPPASISGIAASFTDLSLGSDSLPATDGLRFDLADESRVIIRPSGTEPKLKCYLQVIGTDSKDAELKLAKLTQSARELLADFN
jgi:phosphomannomutase